MNDYLVSVVIPTFNRPRDTLAAIRSVLDQTYECFEILVVDDASTDDTVAQVQGIRDPRVKLLRNGRTKGPSGARNTALLLAKGEYIALLDSDDLFLPNHLEDGVRALSRHTDHSVVFGKARYFQGEQEISFMGPGLMAKVALIAGQRVEPDTILFAGFLFSDLMRHGCFFNLSSVMFRRKVVDDGFMMDEDLCGVDDYEYWLRLSLRYRFMFLQQDQIVYNVSDDGVSNCSNCDREERFFQDIVALFDKVMKYPSLTEEQRRLARCRLAQDYFDRAYQVRRQGKTTQARELYLKSFANKPCFKPLLAFAKTFLPVRC